MKIKIKDCNCSGMADKVKCDFSCYEDIKSVEWEIALLRDKRSRVGWTNKEAERHHELCKNLPKGHKYEI